MVWKVNHRIRRRVAIAGSGMVLLAVGFGLLVPRQISRRPQVIQVTIVVRDNQRVRGPATITARQGDKITINITADRPDELHLHGYDRKLELESNKAESLTFTANLSGQFDYELEAAGLSLGQLRVNPS